MCIFTHQLVAIASELRFLTNLVTLYLSNNHLVSLPPYPPQQGPVMGKLKLLQQLCLRKNLLCALPMDIWEMTALTELILLDNPWTGNPKLKVDMTHSCVRQDTII